MCIFILSKGGKGFGSNRADLDLSKPTVWIPTLLLVPLTVPHQLIKVWPPKLSSAQLLMELRTRPLFFFFFFLPRPVGPLQLT